jgi:hypothetical protein
MANTPIRKIIRVFSFPIPKLLSKTDKLVEAVQTAVSHNTDIRFVLILLFFCFTLPGIGSLILAPALYSLSYIVAIEECLVNTTALASVSLPI